MNAVNTITSQLVDTSKIKYSLQEGLLRDYVIEKFLENGNKGTAKIKVVKNSVIGYAGCGSCYPVKKRFHSGDYITIDKIAKSDNSNSYFGRVWKSEDDNMWISLSSSNIQFIHYERIGESLNF